MSISDLPIMSALKSSMRWHQARQRVLAEDVATADVPLQEQRDLAPLSFEDAVRGSGSGASLVRTDPRHLASLEASSSDPARAGEEFRIVKPATHATLEDLMLKVADNQADFQTAASLYGKSLGLIKTALGRSSQG